MTDAQAFLMPSDSAVPRGRPASGSDNGPVQRRRLISGLVESMAALGYNASTVTDISTRAKVSRRTFYEHFDSKEGAFLVSYQAANSLVSETVLAAVAASESWPERLLNGVRAYVDVMLDHPAASLVFLRESWRAGEPAWALRRRILREWASLLQAEISTARDEDSLLRDVSCGLAEPIALGIVHALEGLVLDAIESSHPADDLLGPCISLIAGAAQVNTQAFTHVVLKTGGRKGVARFVARLAAKQASALSLAPDPGAGSTAAH